MKLSEHTTSILKNYATINQNLVIKKGSELLTMSSMKNIVARAEEEETFPKEIAIYDLNEFLTCLSLFKNPNLEFNDTFVTITDDRQKMNYFYSDPSVCQSPSKTITMPSNEVNFEISTSSLNDIKRAASAINAPDMVLERNRDTKTASLVARDKKNDSANNYSLDVETNGDGEFKFFFKVENLKVMDGDYSVDISSKNITHFNNKSKSLEYWIALEPESNYTV